MINKYNYAQLSLKPYEGYEFQINLSAVQLTAIFKVLGIRDVKQEAISNKPNKRGITHTDINTQYTFYPDNQVQKFLNGEINPFKLIEVSYEQE